jgi:hypothetical protein
MKTLLISAGILIFLAGSVWFLQGINILPGSFMTGQPQWVINGTIAMVIGIGLAFWGIRRK